MLKERYIPCQPEEVVVWGIPMIKVGRPLRKIAGIAMRDLGAELGHLILPQSAPVAVETRVNLMLVRMGVPQRVLEAVVETELFVVQQ